MCEQQPRARYRMYMFVLYRAPRFTKQSLLFKVSLCSQSIVLLLGADWKSEPPACGKSEPKGPAMGFWRAVISSKAGPTNPSSTRADVESRGDAGRSRWRRLNG